MCLELFCRLFLDDVGAESHSVLNELGRFDVKEAKFRREMEKLRNSHQKDLCIEEVRMLIFLILLASKVVVRSALHVCYVPNLSSLIPKVWSSSWN